MQKFKKISKAQYDIDFCAIGQKHLDYDSIKFPHRATKFSAGYDIFSTEDIQLHPGKTIKLPTGIRILLDPDKFLMIVPRSGLGFKYRVQLDNTVGIIDADYYNSDNEGHIWIKITNDSRDNKTLVIHAGDAIAQGIILKYETTDDDEADGIRNGGFGSTSK